MSVLRTKRTFTPKGDTVPAWVLDGGSALDGGKIPDGEVQAELIKQFTGRVRWKGKAESVEADAETKTIKVEVLVPAPKDLPKGIGFAKSVSLTIPDTATAPETGSVLSFTGELKKAKEDDIYPPVYVLYGTGLGTSGEMRIGVNLADVMPAATR